MKLSVMTFNLRLDTKDDGGNAWPHRKKAVIETILSHQPAVLGTQEGLHHMIEFMASSLKDYGKIGQGREVGGEGEYNAIFYKKDELQLIDHGQFWLSETSDIPGSVSWDSACPRICTWGKFRLLENPEKEIVVFNTHLDHVSQLAREKGIALIGTHIKYYNQQDIPTVLMGDFNCEPNNDVIEHVRSMGLTETLSVGRTFHDFAGGVEGYPIDYIFKSQEITPIKSMIDHQTVNQRYPSDHYPVISELKIDN